MQQDLFQNELDMKYVQAYREGNSQPTHAENSFDEDNTLVPVQSATPITPTPAQQLAAEAAPDYVPQIGQFAVHSNSNNKVSIGDFPIIDVYANLHLKHARFFVMMTNVAASSFNRKAFLAPHYPINRQVLKIGVSWNFFN